MNLLNLFKKDNNIYSPCKGKCVDISECQDVTFSQKVLGDGFIVRGNDGIICAPCDGIIKMIFPTLHAFGIEMANGINILVHIGIETVNLNGEGFTKLVELGKKVTKGTPVIKADFDLLKNKGLCTDVITIITGQSEVIKNHVGENVGKETIIVEG